MQKQDTDWFKDRIAAKGMTQAAFGDRLGMDPSSISLMLKGRRVMTLERAAEIAKILDVTLEEVCRHAGISPAAVPDDKIIIIGHIDGNARVTISGKPEGYTVSPGKIPKGSVALVMRSATTDLDMLNGWVVFVGPEQTNAADAVDRSAIVKIKDEPTPLLRLIRRGAGPALYTLTGIGRPPIHDVEIEWLRCALLFRPI